MENLAYLINSTEDTMKPPPTLHSSAMDTSSTTFYEGGNFSTFEFTSEIPLYSTTAGFQQSPNVTNIDSKTLEQIYQILLHYNLAQNLSRHETLPPFWQKLLVNLTAELQAHNRTWQEAARSAAGADDNNLYQVPTGIVILLSVFYGVISLVAVIGNALVMWVVATSRLLHSVTNYFIANLALADIIIGLFSIPFQFQAALLQRWNLPHFMCAFCPFFQTVSVNVSIFTLTAIAVDRYRAICFPLNARPSKFRSRIVLLSIWTFSSVLAVPMAVALRVKMVKDDRTGTETPVCQADKDNMNEMVYSTYSHLLVGIQYFLPLSIVSFTYIKIGRKLWGSRTPGNAEDARDAHVLKNKKKAIKMLFVVVALFAVCWLPLQAYYVLQTIFPAINEYKYINIVWFCFHWLAMSNSCVNPFIYAIYNEKFKREFRHKFRCCFKDGGPLPHDLSEMERSRASHHSFRYRCTRTSFLGSMGSVRHNYGAPAVAGALGSGQSASSYPLHGMDGHSSSRFRSHNNYSTSKLLEHRRRQRLLTARDLVSEGKHFQKYPSEYLSSNNHHENFLRPISSCGRVRRADILEDPLSDLSSCNDRISEASLNQPDSSPSADGLIDLVFREEEQKL